MATVEEFVQSCCTCAAVALCCGNSPLGPQRRIAAAQAQIDSNPALHGLVRGALRLPTDRIEIKSIFKRRVWGTVIEMWNATFRQLVVATWTV